MVHKWIDENPEKLETNYGVNIDEINKEIFAESKGITMETLIESLPPMFENIERITIKELSEYLEVDQKMIKTLIFEHAAELKQKNLDLKYSEGVITKE